MGVILCHTPRSQMVPSVSALDPRDLNKAIIQEHHKAPTLDEIMHKLSGAKVFLKLQVGPT